MKQLQQAFGKGGDLISLADVIFDSTQDAMFIVEVRQDRFYYMASNRSHEKMTGLKPESLVGKTPGELFGPEVGALMERKFRACVDAGCQQLYEESVAYPNGTKDWLVSLTPVKDGDAVSYIVVARQDIGRRKRAEAEKDQVVAGFETMFVQHQASMLLIEPASGNIVAANPAALQFYGYEEQELLNMSIEDINMFPRSQVQMNRLDALEKKQEHFIFPHRLKDGRIRLTDVYCSPIVLNGRQLLFSIIFDVTDREQYKEQLYLEKETFKATLLSIGDGMVTTDNEGVITSMNAAAARISGWPEDAALGLRYQQVFSLLNGESGERLESPVARVLRTGRVVSSANHTVMRTRGGSHTPIAASAAPIKGEDGRIHGVVMVFRDVSKEKEHQKEITRLSYHDFLTGLYNRRYIHDHLKRPGYDWAGHLPVAVILADINGLRLVNSVFGHQEGDRVLGQAAQLLVENCRREDVVARWGGDEFLILLQRTDSEAASRLVDRLKRVVSTSGGPVSDLNMAFGLAMIETTEQRFTAALKEAETDLHRQKLLMSRSQRNTLVNTMLATLYEKSQETEQHAQRLKQHSLAVGQELGLSSQELDELALLAVLHDIGKVGVDAKVLNKPGGLTETEWKEIRRHPEIGYRIARTIPELNQVAEYILYHHERWDGQGYPAGLRGEQIPLQSRILALADAYDAMTSDRPYRAALSPDRALREIKDNAGSQFDPHLSRLFVRLVKPDACSGAWSGQLTGVDMAAKEGGLR